MPQLNKGGKFVFGLSVIRPDLTIHIPPQALSEYDAVRDGQVSKWKMLNGYSVLFVKTKQGYKYGKIRN